MATRLTIGLPVYNGENFLRRAFDSILRQSFSDFRLVVLDNASTDATEAIARSYAERDDRVEYLRHPHNVGAAPNFNRAFELADTEYFKWAAHDDELEPSYLEACVAALDDHPDAALAHSWVAEVDGENNVLETYQPFPTIVSSPELVPRFAGRLMMRGRCTEVFGVIRSDRLRDTKLIDSFVGSDLSLINELALRGPFLVVPEVLFLNRSHPERYTHKLFDKSDKKVKRDDVLNWYDTAKTSKRRQMNWWIFCFENFRMIRRHVRDPRVRIRCYTHALRWPMQWNNAADLMKDVLAVNPWLLKTAMSLKDYVSPRSNQPAKN